MFEPILDDFLADLLGHRLAYVFDINRLTDYSVQTLEIIKQELLDSYPEMPLSNRDIKRIWHRAIDLLAYSWAFFNDKIDPVTAGDLIDYIIKHADKQIAAL